MSKSSNDGHYAVFWPRSPRRVTRKSLAARLETLDGKTVAQLWDFLFRGDEVFALLEEALQENARIPAWQFERILRDWNLKPIWNLTEQVRAGNIPPVFAESDDANRMVPLVSAPENYMIAVSGDPLRTNAYVFAHNGVLGYTVGKRIALPKRWDALRAEGE